MMNSEANINVEEKVEEVKEAAQEVVNQPKTKIESAIDKIKEGLSEIEPESWLRFTGYALVAGALYYSAKVDAAKEADMIVKVIVEEKK